MRSWRAGQCAKNHVCSFCRKCPPAYATGYAFYMRIRLIAAILF